ncbi:MAG: FtsQ-type POTRA domain-containing protein [Syntrophomonas sp.]
MSHARKRRLFSISIFILVLLLSIYLFLHSSIFKVDRVYASGMVKVSQEEILALAGINKGQNIFSVDAAVVSRAVQTHPMVKNAQMVRHLPHDLEIKIVERQVWALVPYQNIMLFLDDEGVCIDRVAGVPIEEYPLITMELLPERVNLGQAVYPAAVQQIKKLWDSMGDGRKLISEFHYRTSSDEIVLYTRAGTEIRFGKMERLDEKLTYIKAVFTMEVDMKKEGHEALEYVDLSFDGEPVMKTKI